MASEIVGDGDSNINNVVSAAEENEKGDSKYKYDKQSMMFLKNYSDSTGEGEKSSVAVMEELRDVVEKKEETGSGENVSSIKSGDSKTGQGSQMRFFDPSGFDFTELFAKLKPIMEYEFDKK